MKIFKTECLLHSQLPNTHVCLSAAQEFCPNPFLWVVISKKTCNKLIFSCFAGICPYFSPTIQSTIESNKLNFMMKNHFGVLPTKSELHVITTEISPFLYNRFKSFSVGRTSILSRDLKVSSQL